MHFLINAIAQSEKNGGATAASETTGNLTSISNTKKLEMRQTKMEQLNNVFVLTRIFP